MHDPIRLNFNLSPDFMVVLVAARMKKIQSKMKALENLECSQHYTLIFLQSRAANSGVMELKLTLQATYGPSMNAF